MLSVAYIILLNFIYLFIVETCCHVCWAGLKLALYIVRDDLKHLLLLCLHPACWITGVGPQPASDDNKRKPLMSSQEALVSIWHDRWTLSYNYSLVFGCLSDCFLYIPTLEID